MDALFDLFMACSTWWSHCIFESNRISRTLIVLLLVTITLLINKFIGYGLFYGTDRVQFLYTQWNSIGEKFRPLNWYITLKWYVQQCYLLHTLLGVSPLCCLSNYFSWNTVNPHWRTSSSRLIFTNLYYHSFQFQQSFSLESYQ